MGNVIKQCPKGQKRSCTIGGHRSENMGQIRCKYSKKGRTSFMDALKYNKNARIKSYIEKEI